MGMKELQNIMQEYEVLDEIIEDESLLVSWGSELYASVVTICELCLLVVKLHVERTIQYQILPILC